MEDASPEVKEIYEQKLKGSRAMRRKRWRIAGFAEELSGVLCQRGRTLDRKLTN